MTAELGGGDRLPIPADRGLAEVNDSGAEADLVLVDDNSEYDAEVVDAAGELVGRAVDGPNDPRTVYATIVGLREHERAPIVPAWLRNGDQRRQFARWFARYAGYCLAFHATRSPRYLVLMLFWGVWGALRLAYRQVTWFWVVEQHGLRQAAASRGDREAAKEWRALNDAVRSMRKFRGMVLAAELVAIVVLVFAVLPRLPLWARLGVALVAVAALSYLGRPADRPILARVTLGPRFVKLTAENVRAALCSIGIAGIKEPSAVKFPQDIHKDGPGWLARVNLPAGVEAVDVLEKRGRLSSALRLPVDQVWPAAGPDHAGQLDLWVGYAPASKMGQPRWSLASPTARTSVFEPHEFGTDERQRPIKTPLFARNFLIGGQPGSGKSYGARTLATIAVLDPTAELKIVEYKGTGDFGDFAPMCSTYACGVGDAEFETGLDMLRWGLAEAERRGARILKAKERGEAPEGKVTPELAARPGSGLHPIVIVIDEAHELFGDATVGKEAAKAAERLIKRGRALGIIVILATQIPDKDSLPPIITRCVTVRWCLAVQDQVANDMVLGTGAYKRGLSATVYRPGADAGWGVATGLEQSGPVRSHFPDPETAAAIVARAAELRAGHIVGGQGDAQQRRDILADVLHVMSERGDHWETLAAQLAQLDGAYSGITPEIVSVRLRALDVASVDVKSGGQVRKGARREAVAEAIARRTLTAG